MALKGLIVLAVAFALLAVLRGAPPALRHGVWTAAFAAMLAVSVLGAFGPGWAVPLLPTTADGLVERIDPVIVCDEAFECEPVGASSSSDWIAAEARSGRVQMLDHLDHAHGVEHATVVIETTDGHVWTKPSLGAVGQWLLGVWALGALVVALRWLAAYASAAFVVRGAIRVTDEGWLDGAERARRLLGIDREVRLLVSDRLTVPVAWGWGAPAIVLPPDADGWDEDRRDAVLLNELAHVRRGDARTQLVAQLALVLHWPNPLAWLAYRRFLTEREHACDDAVLSGGATPSAYAGHLVDIARCAGREPRALAALAPMARRSDLEHRVVAVLDARRRRVAAGRSGLARAVVLGLCVAAPLGVLRPVAAASDETVTAAPDLETDSIQDMDSQPIGDIDEMFDDLGEMDADGERSASGDATLPQALRDTIPRAEDVLGPARESTLAQVRRMRADGLGLDADAWNEIEREVQSAFDNAHADYDAIVNEAIAEARAGRAGSLASAEADRRQASAEMAEAVAARVAAQGQNRDARRAADRNARVRQQAYADASVRAEALREAQQEREEALREAAEDRREARREAQQDREEALREAAEDRRDAQRAREQALREAAQAQRDAQRAGRRAAERAHERAQREADRARERGLEEAERRREQAAASGRPGSGYAYSTTGPGRTAVAVVTSPAVGAWMKRLDEFDTAIRGIEHAAVSLARNDKASPGSLAGLAGGLSGIQGAVDGIASAHSWARSDTEREIVRQRIESTRSLLQSARRHVEACQAG